MSPTQVRSHCHLHLISFSGFTQRLHCSIVRGQNTEWLRSDQDTLYRFAKRVKVRVLKIVETQLPVAHVKLLPSLPNSHTPLNAIQAPRVRYPTNQGTVVRLV